MCACVLSVMPIRERKHMHLRANDVNIVVFLVALKLHNKHIREAVKLNEGK